MLSRGLTSLLDSGKNKAIAAAGPAAAAAAAAAAALVLQASKTYPSPHRNTMLLRDGTTSKNMLPRDLTSLVDSVKNKAIAAAGPAGPAAAASGAARAGAASLQNAPFATPKHHATEGRNDLQKHAAGRLDVPSGF